ncbi:uncharacterized protein L201_001266 [Kwoniella dendrophila CBS 6074]|uniref:Xylanolytic transcriptional activator regulatory domain-containing protein n=1 Tax=Kwoniella dendrophila CBS 6074 TaxID=1295534 RepID=A0AAX4JPA8_9TREE
MSAFQSYPQQQASNLQRNEGNDRSPVSEEDGEEDKEVSQSKANGSGPAQNNRACLILFSRLRLVEAQIGAMQGNLQELLQLQRGAAATAANTDALQDQPPGPLGPPAWGAPPHPPRRADSPNISDEEESIDPLKSAYAAAPWANMLHLAEAARLKADYHIGGDEQGRPKVVSPAFETLDDPPRARKRPRTKSGVDEKSPTHISLNGRGHHGSPDPVDLGWCTLEKGKHLFDLFFERCGCYMPCFDPENDTWESLRSRSPFAITTIIAVAAKCEDASGHAIRMAMDMGLHKSLAYLVEAGMGSSKTPEQMEADRPIVAGARVWLTLYKMEYEMAFAYGRPGLFCSEVTIKDSREFLRHPLSLPTDARLVSSLPLHQPLALAPSNAAQPHPNMDGKLREANRAITDWYNYWDGYYARNGVPKDHFLRETLITGGAGAFLSSNSYVLHGIRSRRDVALLTDERRQWLQEAGRKAQQLVNICLRGQQYANSIQYDYNIVYAARFLIRMATLVPESCNLRQIGKDVEQVAIMLSKGESIDAEKVADQVVPGFMFANLLREVVKKARRDQVLPPASRAPSRLPSPIRNHAALPPSDQNSWSSGLTPNTSFVPSISSGPDISINVDPASGPGFSLDTWFPFPPLDNDLSPLLATGENSSHSQLLGNEGRSWW